MHSYEGKSFQELSDLKSKMENFSPKKGYEKVKNYDFYKERLNKWNNPYLSSKKLYKFYFEEVNKKMQ